MKESRYVLALHPTVKGFAFVLFEGPESPFDWGMSFIEPRSRNAEVLAATERLIERYHPVVLVLEDIRRRQARRSMRSKRLFRSLTALAATAEVELVTFTREALREVFAEVGAETKYEIAQAVAGIIPAFKHRLPPIRKIWQSEDERQSLFDAASLGIAYYVTGSCQEARPWFQEGPDVDGCDQELPASAHRGRAP